MEKQDPNDLLRLSRRRFLEASVAAAAGGAVLEGVASVPALPDSSQSNTAAYSFSVDQDRLHGAPDFSWMNHPLGPADRIFVRKGHFYRVGRDCAPHTADDERVRLFGVSLLFYKTVPDAGEAARIAKRIRRLGINLARYPSGQLVNENEPFPTLDEAAIERFRYWLNALYAEGIYLDLILNGTGYSFKPSRDGLPPLSTSPATIPPASKIFVFYPRLVELQAEYARKLLAALSLKHNPGLALVEIYNEGSLLRAWQTGDVDRYLAGDYEAELVRQWNQYLKTKYETTGALRAAWNKGQTALRGLAGEETVEASNVPLVRAQENLTSTEPRLNDYILFLLSRDKAYWDTLRAAVHEATDPLVPVSATQVWYGGLMNLEGQEEMDYYDLHFYEDHPNFPGRGWDPQNWRIRDSSSIGGGLHYCLNSAATRVAGAPFTISEYNQPWPNTHGAEIDPTLAVFGAFQDWDALMHFCYSTRNVEDLNMIPVGMSVAGNWSQFANLGQAAWVFRSGAIHAAKESLRIAVTKDVSLEIARARKSYPIGDLLHKYTDYDEAIALIHAVGLVRAEDHPAAKPLPPAGSSPYHSDTGEITYEERKLFLVHAPMAAGVFGFLGVGNKASAGAIDVELAPGMRGFITIFLTSLDGRPLRDSRHMLLSLPGYTFGTQPGSKPLRPERLVHYDSEKDWWTLEKDPRFPDKPSGSAPNAMPPAWLERVETVLTLRTTRRRLSVYPLDGTGARLARLGGRNIKRVKGGFRIHLQAEGQPGSPWFEFVVS